MLPYGWIPPTVWQTSHANVKPLTRLTGAAYNDVHFAGLVQIQLSCRAASTRQVGLFSNSSRSEVLHIAFKLRSGLHDPILQTAT